MDQLLRSPSGEASAHLQEVRGSIPGSGGGGHEGGSSLPRGDQEMKAAGMGIPPFFILHRAVSGEKVHRIDQIHTEVWHR